jgi:type II secretory pathway component PulF
MLVINNLFVYIFFIVIAFIIIIVLAREYISRFKNKNILKESQFMLLVPNKKYSFYYKSSFLIKSVFEIIPSPQNITTVLTNIYYSGKQELTIRSTENGIVIYSAFLKNVFFSKEENI